MHGLIPLLALPAAATAVEARLPAWAFMWLLAIAIFAGCKWRTWWAVLGGVRDAANWKRSLSYFLLWPGMDAREFFNPLGRGRQVSIFEWAASATKIIVGVALFWAGARFISLGHPLLGGWAGMVGTVLVLHFGIFQLAALVWQRAGLAVKPIMERPLASRSLSELWGRRWNLGFRMLSHRWVFQPLQKRFGSVAGTFGAFLASGVLHDLVISVPARAGYGLPTGYFLLQGLGVIAERSRTGKRLGLGRSVRGFAWTALIAVGPLYVLFHPWFVMRVMVPFVRAVAG